MPSDLKFMGYKSTWCPGCGDFGILVALEKACKTMGLTPDTMGVVFGIGCSGNMNDFFNAYSMHALHGRSIPNAIGWKLANHKLPIIVIAGDGDCYGEGGNHFLHACRGNHDITVVVHDNGVYGLTTGQSAPTAKTGYPSPSTPKGILETPVNPLALAISQGATFVAQAFSFDPKMFEIIQQAVQHKGFSLVNVLQPCHTYNKVNTKEYYQTRTYKLDETYDPTNVAAAMEKSMEHLTAERFPLGVIYKADRPAYHEQLPQVEQETLLARSMTASVADLTKKFI